MFCLIICIPFAAACLCAAAAAAAGGGDAAAEVALQHILGSMAAQYALLLQTAFPGVQLGTLYKYLYLHGSLLHDYSRDVGSLMLALHRASQRQQAPQQQQRHRYAAASSSSDSGSDEDDAAPPDAEEPLEVLSPEDAVAVLQGGMDGVSKVSRWAGSRYAVSTEVYMCSDMVRRGICVVLAPRWMPEGSIEGWVSRMRELSGAPTAGSAHSIMDVDGAAAQWQALGQLFLGVAPPEALLGLGTPVVFFFESDCSTSVRVGRLAAAATGFIICQQMGGGAADVDKGAGAAGVRDVCTELPAGRRPTDAESACMESLRRHMSTRAPQRLDATGEPVKAKTTKVPGISGL
jgi:hypothetical protein